MLKQIIRRKYILIAVFIGICLIAYAIFSKKNSQLPLSGTQLKNEESEILIPPDMSNLQNNNPNFNPNEKYFFIVSKCEGLFSEWYEVFDYFSANKSLVIKNKNIDSAGLEKLSDKIRKVQNAFSIGNVNELVSEYGDMIKSQCTHYNIDWRLILALIHQESLFNSNAVSRAGAFGLMQIMPRTGLGLQNELNLEDTKTPQNNLTAGMYYYATLVANFEFAGDEKYKFALAAYNAGFGRVVDAMTITFYFGKDYKIWDNVKEYYPYLSSKQDSVHGLVWPNTKRPPAGTLDNWIEPYKYVENIWFYFNEYKKYFPGNLPDQKTKVKKTKKKN
ncbi:MAG: transglycosylase SLT domain-containing protein [Ignavibacteriae bacterium]|nr:transglycosylase SLT domain-containing protein [Ignavibacteriota bacterium]